MKNSKHSDIDFLSFQFAGKMNAFRSTLTPKQESQFDELMEFMFSLFGVGPRNDDDEDGDNDFFIVSAPAKRLTIKVKLKNVTPSIWRKLEIPSNLTLEGLSIVIQIAMGWDGSHLHAFRKGKQEVEEDDETDLPVWDYLCEKGDKLTYEYDFGDGWEHWVELVADPEDGARRKIKIIDGRNACPPEDFGGPWWYTDFLKAWKNHDQAALNGQFSETMEWLDEDFDPTAFDLAAVQEELDSFMAGDYDDDIDDDNVFEDD